MEGQWRESVWMDDGNGIWKKERNNNMCLVED